jgi:hypothetical protein
MMEFDVDCAASATRRTSLARRQEVTPLAVPPAAGDVVIGTVARVGHHKVIETADGTERPIAAGDVCAVVLGRRYSTAEFFGALPEELGPGSEFDLLNVGGVAGRVVGAMSAASGPTVLVSLGHAVDGSGQKITTFDSPITGESKGARVDVVLVVGSSMDSGKTTSAARIIRLLTDAGFSVGGGKLTGTSRMKDLFKMKEAGATAVADFLDVGFPSTFGSSIRDLEYIYETLVGYLAGRGVRVVVMEAADGVFQRENGLILSSKRIMGHVKTIVGCAPDSAAVWGMVSYLGEVHHLVLDFVSGIITSSPLFREETAERISIPFLDDSREARDRLISMMTEKKARVR